MKKYVKYIIIIIVSVVAIATITIHFLRPQKKENNIQPKQYKEANDEIPRTIQIFPKNFDDYSIIDINDGVYNLTYSITTTYFYQQKDPKPHYLYTGTDALPEEYMKDIKKFDLQIFDIDFPPLEGPDAIDKTKLVLEYRRDGIYQTSPKEGTRKILNIKNIDIGDYSIKNEKLMIPDNATYEDLKQQISLSNGLYMKLYNAENQEIANGSIKKDYILKVYDHRDKEIDNYTIDLIILKPNLDLSKLSVDNINLIIKDLIIDTKIGDIKKLITTNGEITVRDSKNNILSDEHRVKTGQTIEFKFNDVKYIYKLSVKGDANGDGEISLTDTTIAFRTKIKKMNLSRVYFDAIDMNNDNKITLTDTTLIFRKKNK